eukprot:scaffold8276_cov62-Phaeocystis_antarctica.AAC.2
MGGKWSKSGKCGECKREWSGGLQRAAGATLAEVEVLTRQLDDRPVEVDGVGRDAAWIGLGLGLGLG